MITRLAAACALALFFVSFFAPADLSAQGNGKGRGGGGGGENVDPLHCFDGAGIPTQSTFDWKETIFAPTDPDPDTTMFGRPMTAAQMPLGNIVLAVGARNPARIVIYELNPDDGTVVSSPPAPVAVVPLADIPRRMVTADLNGDSIPDFVVTGFGDVEVLMSPDYLSSDYVPESLHLRADSRNDSIAATPNYIAVGVGGGKRDSGDVFIYGSDLVWVKTVSGDDVGSPRGAAFGRAVALQERSVESKLFLDLIVGAPLTDTGKTLKDRGEVFVISDVLGSGGVMMPPLAAANDRLGSQAAFFDGRPVAATSWLNDDIRADVYDGLTTIPLEPASPSLGVGWASVGIYTGTISNTPSVIIGAPNGHCEDWDHAAGVAYLYVDPLGSNPTTEIFVPPHDPDNNDPIPADWNVFGWSADIVSTGPSNDNDFVIIGEPGFRGAGRVYVYRRQQTQP